MPWRGNNKFLVITTAAKSARAHFASKWPRPSHRPPQGRHTPRCSVPVSSTRWAASGASPLMKPSCVGMCKDKPTHVQLCNPMRSREKKSRNLPAAGARETQNRLPRKRKHYRLRLAHASNFSFCVSYGRGGALRSSHRGRSALPTCIRMPQTPKPFCLPVCCLLPVTIMD